MSDPKITRIVIGRQTRGILDQTATVGVISRDNTFFIKFALVNDRFFILMADSRRRHYCTCQIYQILASIVHQNVDIGP